MFKKYKGYIYYKGRKVNANPTLSDLVYMIWKDFVSLFTRWKLIDTSKYTIEPRFRKGRFQLSDLEIEQADKIYKEKGTIEYTFYPCAGIGWGVKVKVWETGEYIDITDVSVW